jgi:hypothetical protein
MGTKNRISNEVRKQAKAFLTGLPKKEPDGLSLKELVLDNAKEIEGALRKGYSHKEIAQLLSQKFEHVQISEGTLKSYLRSKKDTPTTKQKKKSTNSKPSTPPSANPSAPGEQPLPVGEAVPHPDIDTSSEQTNIAFEVDSPSAIGEF